MRRTTQAVSAAEVCLHLAGGTARDYVRLRQKIGRRLPWTTAPRDLVGGAGLTQARLRRLERGGDRALAAAEVARVEAAGARLVSWRHEDYPAPLRHLPQPPLLLVVRGRWPVPEHALAVVGARAATTYGEQAARRLAGAAARAGVPVVSGLARGIDRHGLQAALDEGGWPVAVLGCGLDVYYPSEHRALQDAIAARGTLVSEFPMGQRPDRFAFPRRNRIIAALARFVLVVEAGARSGALITVDHALEVGREVLAVPGPIDSEASAGTNRMIADGAHPILDEAWLLSLLGRPAPGDASPAGTAAGMAAGTAGGASGASSRPAASNESSQAADTPDDALLRALGARPASVDELAERTGRPVGAVRSALIALELAGAVRRLPGGRCVRREDGPLAAGGRARRRGRSS